MQKAKFVFDIQECIQQGICNRTQQLTEFLVHEHGGLRDRVGVRVRPADRGQDLAVEGVARVADGELQLKGGQESSPS